LTIVDLVPAKQQRDKEISEILASFREASKIVLLKEDDNVIRSIIRGVPKTQILTKLQNQYPEEKLTMTDIDNFLYSYKELLVDEKRKMESMVGRRLLKQQEGLTNELIDLAQTTQRLVTKYDEQGDNVNTIAAIRTAADIFMKVGKIEGIFNEKPEVNVNMQMDKVVTEVTTGDSEFKKAIMNIVNSKPEPQTIDAEIVEDGNREKDIRTDS
jgi:hypothetical protein